MDDYTKEFITVISMCQQSRNLDYIKSTIAEYHKRMIRGLDIIDSSYGDISIEIYTITDLISRSKELTFIHSCINELLILINSHDTKKEIDNNQIR